MVAQYSSIQISAHFHTKQSFSQKGQTKYTKWTKISSLKSMPLKVEQGPAIRRTAVNSNTHSYLHLGHCSSKRMGLDKTTLCSLWFKCALATVMKAGHFQLTEHSKQNSITVYKHDFVFFIKYYEYIMLINS